MAENSSSQERTEQATPRRREEARKQGTVARSIDLTSSLVMLVLLLAFPTILALMGSGFTHSLNLGLRTIPADLSIGSLGKYIGLVVGPSLPGLIVVMSIALVIGVGVTTAQVGLVASSEAFKFKFDKLNPVSGFKRLFSPTPLFEAGKALAKSFVFGFIAWMAISRSWPTLAALGRLAPNQVLAQMIGGVQGMATQIVLAWLLLAGIDYFFQRKRIDKQLMMTKEEIRQEMRQNEQSQELRGAIARQRRRLGRSRIAQAMKQADVVITNPTHYAIAIEYDAAKSTAPIVIAKGADHLAAKIRELAKENNVPIVPNPPLARTLYARCELGDAVPRDLFQPVAEVLAYVYKTLKRVRKN